MIEYPVILPPVRCGWCDGYYIGDRMAEAPAEPRSFDGYETTGICPMCLENIKAKIQATQPKGAA